MRSYKILKSNDSAFPYNIWSESRNSFIAKVYTKEMAELILGAIVKEEKDIQAASNRVE